MRDWIDEEGKTVMIFTDAQLLGYFLFSYFLGLFMGWLLL